MAKTIDNFDDIIDSRDVIARIETLQSEVDDQREHYGLLWDEDDDHQENWTRDTYIADSLRETHQDEMDELKVLLALQEEANYGDWQYGAQLIRDSYFVTHAQELAEEVCELPNTWPLNCIDWDHAAMELQYDYSAVDFDGVTYWIRS